MPRLDRGAIAVREILRKRARAKKPDALVLGTDDGVEVPCASAPISHDENMFVWNNLEQVRIEERLNRDNDIKLLKNFASEAFHRRFTNFDAPARKLPFASFVQQ